MSPVGPSNFINGRKISSNADQAIYEHIHCKTMFQRWVRKGRMPSTNVCQQVNWKATTETMKELKITWRHWIVKHISDHCSMNSKLMEWGCSQTDECPHCGKFEDAQHIWLCQDPEAHVKKLQGLMKI